MESTHTLNFPRLTRSPDTPPCRWWPYSAAATRSTVNQWLIHHNANLASQRAARWRKVKPPPLLGSTCRFRRGFEQNLALLIVTAGPAGPWGVWPGRRVHTVPGEGSACFGDYAAISTIKEPQGLGNPIVNPSVMIFKSKFRSRCRSNWANLTIRLAIADGVLPFEPWPIEAGRWSRGSGPALAPTGKQVGTLP